MKRSTALRLAKAISKKLTSSKPQLIVAPGDFSLTDCFAGSIIIDDEEIPLANPIDVKTLFPHQKMSFSLLGSEEAAIAINKVLAQASVELNVSITALTTSIVRQLRDNSSSRALDELNISSIMQIIIRRGLRTQKASLLNKEDLSMLLSAVDLAAVKDAITWSSSA